MLALALKPSDDGGAWIVRLFGASGEPTEGEAALVVAHTPQLWLSDLSEKPLKPLGWRNLRCRLGLSHRASRPRLSVSRRRIQQYAFQVGWEKRKQVIGTASGFILVTVAGVANATFARPMKFARQWAEIPGLLGPCLRLCFCPLL